MGISVKRHIGVGSARGGQAIGDEVFQCDWPAAVISIYVDEVGIWMSRDEASEVAQAIIECLLDG